MPDKPDSSKSNFFNRLTELVVQKYSMRVLYLAVSQSLEAVESQDFTCTIWSGWLGQEH